MAAEERLKIIDIMGHPPDYKSYANKPRPPVNWDTPGGSWVGIWGYDWADQIGSHILEVDNTISYEVWQPDLRADRVYSHQFDNGLIHKSFPTELKKQFSGLKKSTYCYSNKMLDILLNKNHDEATVLVLPPHVDPFVQKVIGTNIPSLHNCLGLPENLLGDLQKTLNPIKFFHKYLIKSKNKKSLKKIKNIVIGCYLPNGKAILEKFVKGKIYTNLVGIDLDLYKVYDRSEARNLLGINQQPFALFTSSRLVSIKQVDKIILSLEKSKGLDFIFFISGHGERSYEKYLQNLIFKTGLEKKIKMVGYVSEADLVKYYAASDVFVNASCNDGGPMSAWKAMAMGVPVVNADIGNVYHFLLQEKAGLIINRENYFEWGSLFNKVISRQIEVKIPPVDKVRNLLNWKNISMKYIQIFEDVVSKEY